MGTKKKADYMVDNGSDWDQMLFSTTAEQVGFTKSDGSETNLQDEVTALNSHMFTDKRIATLTVTGSWSMGYDLGDKKLIQIVVLDGVPSIRTSIVVSKEALSTSCTSAKPYLLYNKSGGTIAQFYVANNKLYLFAYGGYIIHAYV